MFTPERMNKFLQRPSSIILSKDHFCCLELPSPISPDRTISDASSPESLQVKEIPRVTILAEEEQSIEPPKWVFKFTEYGLQQISGPPKAMSVKQLRLIDQKEEEQRKKRKHEAALEKRIIKARLEQEQLEEDERIFGPMLSPLYDLPSHDNIMLDSEFDNFVLD